MDIGVWMSPSVLESKLDQADTAKPEAAWNFSRWPRGFDEHGPHRLFVASAGRWVGYFLISSEALYLPEDEKTPFVLLFDTASWTEIPPVEAKRFRGFTYDVPPVSSSASGSDTSKRPGGNRSSLRP